MFPYPSGSGLHMGHAFNYEVGDVFARHMRMKGLNVLYPMGYDSFGLPAENAAIKTGQHPKKYTEAIIKNFIEQQKKIGLSYDWDRIVMTHKPEDYKWNQFFFLKFLKKIKSASEKKMEEMEKEGVLTGSYAKNPVTGDKVPVYAGNFVVADYGSGMVMAVPGHDQRDFEFSSKYNIPIKIVIQPENKKIDIKNVKEAYTGSGMLVNSGPFNGLFSEEAKEHITKALEFKKHGRKTVNYKFRDWLVS